VALRATSVLKRIIMKTVIKSTILLFLVVYFYSCASKSNKNESGHEILAENAIELNSEQYKTAGIQLGKLGNHVIETGITVNGTVKVTPQNIATVSALLGGFIKNTTIVQGSAVNKGDVLVTIENFQFIEIQQDYLETKAKFDYAEIEYKRHSELFKENVYSEKNLQQTETEFRTLKAQLRGIEQKLILLGIDPANLTEEKISGTLPLLAPISGYIRTVDMSIGKFVNPSDVLCEIVNPENVVLELVVFEKDVQKVAAGQQVSFSNPNDPQSKYSATIYQAGKALDNNKTAMAYARIDRPDGTLLSGTFVNATILVSSSSGLAIPDEAVVQFNEKWYIFAFKGSRKENGKDISDFEALEVTKGASGKGFTMITLPGGTDPLKLQVVLKGAYAALSAWKNAGEMAC
jgi:membrane fusion protein, heavy metal efflux system